MDNKTQTPLERVIEWAGSRRELGRKLALSPAATYQWKQIPIGRVAQLSAMTGIPRAELRPDIFA